MPAPRTLSDYVASEAREAFLECFDDEEVEKLDDDTIFFSLSEYADQLTPEGAALLARVTLE